MTQEHDPGGNLTPKEIQNLQKLKYEGRKENIYPHELFKMVAIQFLHTAGRLAQKFAMEMGFLTRDEGYSLMVRNPGVFRWTIF